jgi:hypothetical protein
MNIKTALAATAVLLALADAAFAFGPGGPHGPGPLGRDMLFDLLDTNQDGKISAEEFDAGQAERFKTFDADGDGKISPEEFAKGDERMREKIEAIRFKKLDANQDGFLSAEEFAVPGDRLFGYSDRNGDGAITPNEMGGPGGKGRWPGR